mgnify:CR=1 FL=1
MICLPKIATAPRLLLIAAVVLLGVLQAVSLLGLTWLTQTIINTMLNDAGGFRLSVGGGLLLLVLFGALCRWLERGVAERLGHHYVHEVRLKIFDTLAIQAGGKEAALPDHRQGVHMVRFSNDLSALRLWVSMGLARLISAGLFFAGVIIALSVLSVKVAVAVMCMVILSLAVMALLSTGLERSVREMRRNRGRLANGVATLVFNMSHVVAYGRVPKERKRLLHKSQMLGDSSVRRAFWVGGIRGVTDFFHRVILFIALVIGAWGIQAGETDVSDLLTILGVAALVGTPLRDLSRVFEYWKNNLVAREKIARVLSRAKGRGRANRRLPEGDGELIMKGDIRGLISLPYLTVSAGQRIVVTGSNGVGKSTLLQAIAGLLPSDSGYMSLDGIETKDLSYAARRQGIGIASSQIPLIPGSVSKNIRYRKPSASREEVAYACDLAGISKALFNFPEGLKTRVGMFGSGLSDGQTVRVKLARAVLGKPRLLLFDEIESGLDQAGYDVLHRLLENYPGTVIYATHDQRLLRHADRVWLMEDGCLYPKIPEAFTDTGEKS